jgi:hypothetical protein
VTFCHRHRGAALIASTLLVTPAFAAGEREGGGLLGWVENTQGMPVAGAVISVFGKGIRGGTLVTLSDSSGQFFLPSLPAGSYTLRALGRGHQPAPAQTITVLPRQDSVFTVSLRPVGEATQNVADPAAVDPLVTSEDEARRELRWLMRHKRRSILEYIDESLPTGEGGSDTAPIRADLAERAASVMPALAGTFEVVAVPSLPGHDGELSAADGLTTSQGVLKLHGKMSDFGEWRLGGLVTESEQTAWRMSAEFVLTPGEGHEIQTGTGYGTRYIRPLAGDTPGTTLDARSVGSLFARDTWSISERWTASFGGRYSFVGFLQDGNSVDGFATMERALGKDGRLRGSFSTKTLTPGGDLLTLSTLAAAPMLSLARLDESLRAERTTRYELGVDRTFGAATVGTFLFREGTADRLVNLHGGHASDTLRIVNGGALTVEGIGFTMARRFGNAVSGSVAYTYGRTAREGGLPGVLPEWPGFSVESGDARYHDVVARVEAFIDLTDTRLTAYYRINTLDPEGVVNRPIRNTRFDIRLTQGLPFLQPLTRADWELLVAVRNLFYEDFEGGTLDELAVLHAPKRVMGGFAVKF